MDNVTTSGLSGFQIQPANWTIEIPPDDVWVPAGFFPLEYPSTDMFGTTCYSFPHVQQLVEHYYYSAASQDDGISHSGNVAADGEQNRLEVKDNKPANQVIGDDPQDSRVKVKTVSRDWYATRVCKKVEREFIEFDIKPMKQKMHRYPASLQALDESYRVPRIVAIGPYHHDRTHLKLAEKVKHIAAIHCVKQAADDYTLEDLYYEVADLADRCRCLYDKDVMRGIGYDDFRHMMFFDACFLVQYVLMEIGRGEIDKNLAHFLGPNDRDIRHDVMLLENQLPWKVFRTVFDIVKPSGDLLDSYTSTMKNYLQHHRLHEDGSDAAEVTVAKDKDYSHLLGLQRYYTVGTSTEHATAGEKPKDRSISISARELAQIGISLTASNTTKLIDMALKQEGKIFAELSLAPLALDRNRATCVVNMAAYELCTVKSFGKAPLEDSAVCSYLLLLAMLVHREEDVQELRKRGVLQGGAGLTDKEAVTFFTRLQGLRFGRYYNRVMKDIETYKNNRRRRSKLYEFFFKNKKTIGITVTGVTAFATVIGTLASIKQSL